MAADKSDDPGVLGNLPRSRPGHRSDKRGAGTRGAVSTRSGGDPPASSKSRSKASRAKSAPARGSKRAAGSAGAATRETRAQVEPPRPAETASHGAGDPLTGVVRLAGKVAEAGLKTAGSLLRRLPGR